MHRSCLVAALIAIGPVLHAQDAARDLAGPDSVGRRLAEDAADKPELLHVDEQAGIQAWKATVKEKTGLDFGLDYNVLGFAATESLGEDTAASGALRFFGTWELFERDTPNNGSLVFKVENRHTYTDVPPAAFGGELGYTGWTSSVFGDQGWKVTHLFWQQRFAEGRGVSYVGFLDTTDYVDVHTLASPWSAFNNQVFQNGSGAIGGLPDGALGAMVGGFLTDHIYLVGGLADANGDATEISKGFDTFFNDFETFKSLELGWTSSREQLFSDNAHVSFWQVDERSATGTPDGWGVSLSLAKSFGDSWQTYLRGGWAEDGGSLYEAAVGAGFGYSPRPGQSLLGLGVNWSRPNESTYGPGLDDQITVELFQQLQLTEGIEIAPSLQFIHNPAFNPEDDSVLLFGLRMRMAL